MEVFGEIIHAYTFDDHGLFLWMKNNLSETMTASSAYMIINQSGENRYFDLRSPFRLLFFIPRNGARCSDISLLYAICVSRIILFLRIPGPRDAFYRV